MQFTDDFAVAYITGPPWTTADLDAEMASPCPMRSFSWTSSDNWRR